MPDRLLLRFAPDGGLTWLRQRSGAPLPASAPGVPPADVVASVREVVVLVPSEDVLLTEARLAARNRAQLLKAVPYAVEDLLLDPVEELHFAAAHAPDDAVGVAVVAPRVLEAWLERLGAAGIEPDALLPEALALPVTTGRIHAMIDGDRAIVRLAPWSSLACSLGELEQRLACSGIEQPLEVHDFRASTPLSLPHAVVAYHERQRDPLAWLAQRLATAPLNLLEGRYAPRRRARGSRARSLAAMLAAAVIVLAFADLGIDVAKLSRASRQLDLLARDEARAAFPDIDAAQLDRASPGQLVRERIDRLRGASGSGALLRRLAAIGPVIASSSRIQTHAIEYRNGGLELALRAPDVAALDFVRERLAAVPGLRAEVTAANPGADGVDGRIRVLEGAAP